MVLGDRTGEGGLARPCLVNLSPGLESTGVEREKKGSGALEVKLNLFLKQYFLHLKVGHGAAI